MAQRMTAQVRRVGPDRVLLGIYLVFVVAAGSRSVVQLATHAGRAPLAYGLSLASAVVYAVGFILVRRLDTPGGVTALRICSAVELAGVLVVGTWSVVDRSAFPDATVWSDYGAGYFCVPLAVPLVVLIRLR